MCEKHKVIEHGQKCMKILVNLHKENPDWQNKNGKKKKKGKLRGVPNEKKKKKVQIDYYCIILMVQLRKLYIYKTVHLQNQTTVSL